MVRTLPKPWDVGKPKSRRVQKGTANIPVWAKNLFSKGYKPPELTAKEIEGRHAGELIFVLGNGPSLLAAEKYRKAMAKFVLIGVNFAYLFTHVDYMCFGETKIWNYLVEDIMILKTGIFYPLWGLPYRRLPCFTRFRGYPRKNWCFSSSWKNGLFLKGSSIAAANLAYLFGASQIALLGVDLNDWSHFYTGKEKQYRNRLLNQYGSVMSKKGSSFPNVKPRLKTWHNVARQMEKANVKIWNCSANSALKCFEKIELGKLLEQNKNNKKKVYPEWENKLKKWAEVAKNSLKGKAERG